ncbi:MAG: hypothetical protein ABI472_24570 [Ginsengibacter sp.]
MAKSKTIAAIILGAAVGVALLKFYNLPKEEKDEFFSYLKDRTNELLDDAEETVEKVEHFIDEIKIKEENEWIDKLYIVKRMFRELYGSDQRYLL